VSGKYTEELQRAPDDVLSLLEAVRKVGLSRLTNFERTLTRPSVNQRGLHSGSGLGDESMAYQYHSRTSTGIQSYAGTCCFNLSQLNRNQTSVLDGIKEEVELTCEEEFAPEGCGVFPPMFDSRY
jgi:hypothetical protein